ncbi:MAG TPA: mandelate racemase/muconate lactonizing enzyme family protein [Candidatus Saccharimonadales bacterium]|nr:mandelate racemase/muconate lactonizing enzyme family protein [Candidatus Saccharimonadales bacterium]
MVETKIEDIQVTGVNGNFPWVIVKITAKNGMVGYGEAYAGDRPEGEAAYLRRMILDILKPRLIGENPLDIDRLTSKLGLQFNIGPKAYGISGIQIALLDLSGKVLNTPAYNLLNGKFSDTVRIYADCHGGHLITGFSDYDVDKPEFYTPSSFGENARRIKKMGYTLLKFDLYPNLPSIAPGGSGRRPELVNQQTYQIPPFLTNSQIDFMAGLMRGAREAVGFDVGLAVDLYGYSTVDAIRLGNAMEDLRLAWIEDPVPGNTENVDALREVTRSIRTPTLTGEFALSMTGFREVVQKQAVRIISPDIITLGGPLEAKKAALLADLYYIPTAPHNIASPIGTMATAHLSASLSRCIGMEMHAIDVPVWEKIVKNGNRIIENGEIKLSDKPGLGIEPDEQAIAQNLIPGEQPFR